MMSDRRHKRCWWGPGLLLLLLSMVGCSEEAKEHTAAAIYDRDSVSMMTSYGVNTLISDSGVIKYRIVTERWDVNVIRQPNRWEFNGLNYRSEELYWDGIRHEFYSHVFSQVITPERTLQGTYFRSDERMTIYTVSNSKGSFIPEENNEEETSGSPAPVDTTTEQSQAPVRPAARKHAKSVE